MAARRRPTGKKKKPHPLKRRGARFKRSLLEAVDLPMEAEGSTPKLTIVGRCDLLVENHTGVLQCGMQQVRLLTCEGVISITGEQLKLLELAKERAYVKGKINNVEYS